MVEQLPACATTKWRRVSHIVIEIGLGGAFKSTFVQIHSLLTSILLICETSRNRCNLIIVEIIIDIKQLHSTIN